VPYLLDTHVWLWGVNEPDRLPASIRREFEVASEPPRLSPISFWEVLLLAEKGRIALSPSPQTWLREAARSVREVPLTFEVAAASRRLRLSHEDPADRFIAATAKVFGLRLVTADARLLRCPDVETVWGY